MHRDICTNTTITVQNFMVLLQFFSFYSGRWVGPMLTTVVCYLSCIKDGLQVSNPISIHILLQMNAGTNDPLDQQETIWVKMKHFVRILAFDGGP